MLGLMQDQPLLVSSLIEFAARHHADAEIVSRRIEGDLHRYTYRQAAVRSRQVAHALDRLGLAFSDRVGTLAWNVVLSRTGKPHLSNSMPESFSIQGKAFSWPTASSTSASTCSSVQKTWASSCAKERTRVNPEVTPERS